MPVGTDTITPMWRGVVVLRLVCAAFACGAIVENSGGYARPDAGWAVLVAILGWTAVTSIAYSRDAGRRIAVIAVDLVVTLALMASSAWVLSADQLAQVTESTPLLTTVWSVGPVVAAAVHVGRIGGVSAGVAVSLVNWLVRGFFSTDIARDTVLLVGTGFVLGLAAVTARRAEDQLRRAVRAEAATAERERLARSIHDGVLQVLARVRTRSDGLGGEAAELARLAGEQEIALRALVSAAPPGSATTGEADLGSAMQLLAGAGVAVSVPAEAVPLPASDVEELVAVAREALSNTERHAGPDAESWLLVEDLGDEVVLTVRDDGEGIADGRLDDAKTDGRMGVSRSIRGRVADLGGMLRLDTGPGCGTEWEVRLARKVVGR
ncbi:MAG: ATP-binding protein [Pseudonocardiaceae bacterium]|nr:ATP-binding protein [Pseudonocardiaceae bacterium]